MKGVKKRPSANEVNDYGKINAFFEHLEYQEFLFCKVYNFHMRQSNSQNE